MMSIVDRVNRRLTARLRRGASDAFVEDDALRIVAPDGSAHRLCFAELSYATVLVRNVYAADAILLRLEWPDAKVEIFQDNLKWPALVAALDRTGRLTTPSRLWQVQIIADGPDATPRNLL